MNNFQKRDYLDKAAKFKALGHPTRLWIVSELSDNMEHCVCEFVDAIDADFSTISKHLSVLKQAGIISDDKRGKQVYYKLTLPCLADLLKCESF